MDMSHMVFTFAAVPDGLKAWEMLKGSPESVDLILTEVDLPSVSGYALLTLVMEHEICKNIPVIMMSTQDSVSTVYKCMLRGAADYLVKPLRRNELRNLWQHVWRRQRSFSAGDLPLDESVGQLKFGDASENSSTNNNENTIERDQQPLFGEQSGDSQSSCTMPELEDESAEVYNNQRDLFPTKNGKSLFNDIGVSRKEKEKESTRVDEIVSSAERDSCREAINLMGVLVRRDGECERVENTSKQESRIELDLSLRRPNASENQTSAEHGVLWPSNASAFMRYVHRPLQTQCSLSPEVPVQGKCIAADLDEQNSSGHPLVASRNNDQTTSYTRANARGPPLTAALSSWPPLSSYPALIPVIKGIQISSPNSGYTSALAPDLAAQSSPMPMPGPTSVSPHEYNSRFHSFPQSSLENGIPECSQERENYRGERRYISSVVEPSVIGGLCNGVYYGSASGSSSNADQRLTGKTQRSLQREAALTKFRMKRRDRCFEKKVRYESRKKLAEQRPRVKGQFVRQIQASEPSSTTQDSNAAAQHNPC